jgi:hypothetical protein
MWWKIIIIVILGLTVIIAVALVNGSHRWQSATKTMNAKLEEVWLPIEPRRYDSIFTGLGVEYSLSSLFTILHTFDLERPRKMGKMGRVIKVSFQCLNLHFFSKRVMGLLPL